jgi:hypothetical protein
VPGDLPVQVVAKHPAQRGCVGRFLTFAIYSQTDSPQECQSDEKYQETKSLFLPETIRGYTFDTNIHTPSASPAVRQVLFCAHGERFSRAAQRAR